MADVIASSPSIDTVDLPTDGHTGVIHAGRIVIYGGKKSDGTRSGDVWVLDPATGALDYMPPRGDVPRARHYHTAHAFEDTMYVINGVTDDGNPEPEPNVPTLNLHTFTWGVARTRGDVPHVLFNHASALVNNIIYVLGGYHAEEKSFSSVLYALNLDDLVWRRLDSAPRPTPLWGHSLIACGGNLVAYGGVSMEDDEETETAWMYSIREDRWSSFHAAKSDPSRPTVVKAKFPFPVKDGNPKQLPLSVGDILDVSAVSDTTIGDKSWLRGKVRGKEGREGWFPANHVTLSLSSAPQKRNLHSAAAVDSKSLCIWGGTAGEETPERFSDAWIFNVRKGRWKEVGKGNVQPPALSGQPLVWHGGMGILPMLQRRELWRLDPERGWQKQPLGVMYSGVRSLSPGSPLPDPPTPGGFSTAQTVQSSSVPGGAPPTVHSRGASQPQHPYDPAGNPPPSPSQSSSTVHNLSQVYFANGGSQQQQQQQQQHHPSSPHTQRDGVQQAPSAPSALPSQAGGGAGWGGSPSPQQQQHHHSAVQIQGSPHRVGSGATVHTTVAPHPGGGGTVVNGVTISPMHDGNMISVDRSGMQSGRGGQGDAPVVVYVMGGGGGGSILPAGYHAPPLSPTSVAYAPQVAPYGQPGMCSSIPSEPLREPAKTRLASRQRTSSPDVHTPSDGRARAIMLPTPPEEPLPVPGGMAREGSHSPTGGGRRGRTESTVADERAARNRGREAGGQSPPPPEAAARGGGGGGAAGGPASSPADPLMQPASAFSHVSNTGGGGGGVRSRSPRSPPLDSSGAAAVPPSHGKSPGGTPGMAPLQRGSSPGRIASASPAGGGGAGATSPGSQPIASQPQPSGRRSPGAGAGGVRSRSPPASRVNPSQRASVGAVGGGGGGVGTPESAALREAQRESSPGRPGGYGGQHYPAPQPSGEPGPLAATPAVLTQCPAQAATPPRPLIPATGRPHSPPRSTPSTHGMYDLSATEGPVVRVDGPAGTPRRLQDMQAMGEVQHLSQQRGAHPSRREVLSWGARTPLRRDHDSANLWC